MIKKNLPRLLIGAAGSGCGKTTFTCGILQAFSDAGRKPVSFKCGPDYIDPMFHTEVLGIPSRNLDLFFSDENMVQFLMAKHGAKGDLAVAEGVMGYYDGLAGISKDASTYDLGRATKTPAILLVDGRGKSVSLLAEIKGFLELEPESGIKGIVLNRVSAMIYPELKDMIEAQLPVTVYGYLPKMEECSLESRHLGLVTAKEMKNLQQIIRRLADQISETVDVQGLIKLAQEAEELSYEPPLLPKPAEKEITIGVARDPAFCFYYEDNLELLKQLGARLAFFSPMEDEKLPEGAAGLIFGGGYPELYLSKLSNNNLLRNQIRGAVQKGMPCFAECGGFMYLQQTLQGQDGRTYPMAGVITGESFPLGKLSRFGYITLTAQKDTVLCKKGQQIKGHEFHYWDSTHPGDAFHAQKPLRKKNWQCIVAENRLFAGYPHLYFYSNPEAAKNFLTACIAFQKEREQAL